MEEKLTHNVGGRPRIAPATPEELWEKFLAYCDHCTANTMTDPRSGAEIPRPLTWVGFMAYLGVAYRPRAFKEYYNTIEGYSAVLTRIENEIEAGQLDGAMLGIYTPNLVARLNGYTEKTDNKHEVKGGFVWKEIE